MSFRLVLTGAALPGHTPQSIREGLQARLKLAPAQVEALLPPAVRVVKSGLDRSGAERWLAVLRQVGLGARVEAIGAATPVSRAETKPREVASAPAPAATAVAESRPVSRTVARKPESSPEPARQGTSGDPLEALQALARSGLKCPPPSREYVRQLVLVTLCCLLVPVLYLALMAGLGLGLVWYLGHVHEFLGDLGSLWLQLLAYGVPALSGGILLLFLARPLFLGSASEAEPLELDLAAEPRLAAVIQQLCQAIGLNPPVAVLLSNEVNASVHFEHGWRGFFSDRKVLTIGMPLVAGLSAQQFVGVLAHEFGHFGQRLGMRCHFLINRVNAWLESRAHFSDPWDERLAAWQEQGLWWGWQLAIRVAQQGIALTRLLMRGGFWLSFRVSRALSRQMEFDADRYETLVAGSATFRRTALRLRVLGESLAAVERQNARAWRERRLLRDIPEACMLQAESLDAGILCQLEQRLEESATRYWDSHPADLERIRHSEALRAPGHLHDERPAALLFADFAALCRCVTQAWYAERGLDHREEQLLDSQAILQLNARRDQALEQLHEWTGRQWRPLPWLALHLAPQEAHRKLDWQGVVDELRRLSPEIARAWEQAEADEARRATLAWCLRLHKEGIEARVSDQEAFDPEHHGTLHAQIAGGQTPAHWQLHLAASLYRRRLELSLAGADARQREAGRLLLQLSHLYGDYASLREAWELARRFRALREQSADVQTERLAREALRRFRGEALALLAKADGIPQGLLDGETLGGYLRLRCPLLDGRGGDPLEFFEQGCLILDSLDYAHRRVMAKVASFCVGVEARQGIRGIRLLADMGPQAA